MDCSREVFFVNFQVDVVPANGRLMLSTVVFSNARTRFGTVHQPHKQMPKCPEVLRARFNAGVYRNSKSGKQIHIWMSGDTGAYFSTMVTMLPEDHPPKVSFEMIRIVACSAGAQPRLAAQWMGLFRLATQSMVWRRSSEESMSRGISWRRSATPIAHTTQNVSNSWQHCNFYLHYKICRLATNP